MACSMEAAKSWMVFRSALPLTCSLTQASCGRLRRPRIRSPLASLEFAAFGDSAPSFFKRFETAVFKPEKEKSKSLLLIIGRGRLNLKVSPCKANLAISGPPGHGKLSSRAHLSKHSPAASSEEP